jgi:hypothetical protein
VLLPVDTAECECANERICHDLEGQRRERGIITGRAAEGLLGIINLKQNDTTASHIGLVTTTK